MTVFRLNPNEGETGIWEVMPAMGEARLHFVAANVRGKLFVWGGSPRGDNWQSTGTCECLVSARGQWDAAEPMLTSRFRHCGAAIERRLYVCGDTNEHVRGNVLPSTERFDAVRVRPACHGTV